jgi:hypothetical protein
MASEVVLQHLRNDITQLQLAQQQSNTQLKVCAMRRGKQALASCWVLVAHSSPQSTIHCSYVSSLAFPVAASKCAEGAASVFP